MLFSVKIHQSYTIPYGQVSHLDSHLSRERINLKVGNKETVKIRVNKAQLEGEAGWMD